MKIKTAISIVSSLAIMSCGSDKKSKKDDAPQAQTEVAPSTEGEKTIVESAPAKAEELTTTVEAKKEAPVEASKEVEAKETQASSTEELPKAPEAPVAPADANIPANVVVKVPVDEEGKEDHTQAELRIGKASDAPAKAEGDEIVKAFQQAETPASFVEEDELDKTSSTQSWFFGLFNRNYNYNYRFNSCYYPTYYSYGSSYTYNTVPTTYSYGGYNYYYYNRPSTFYNQGYNSYGYNNNGYGFGANGGYGY